MLYNSDDSTRRTLCFPAVRPSETVSETTLVNSLLCLTKQICNFKANHFVLASNKRNAKNALRLIHVLQLILEGLRDVGRVDQVGKSVISSLLDLHVALQKIYFLVEDCTRQDARVWMLVNAELVGGHFRALLGSVAASFDAIVSVGDGFNDEVSDLIMFLIQQGRRQAQFEAQMEDLWAIRVVQTALDRFERQVIPSPNELRRVMDFLGIKKWGDCNNQVKFLEKEIGYGSGHAAARLMSLMVYCRCVLFDHIDDDISRVESKKFVCNMEYLNSDDIVCPISLEIMVDPVTISTGHTYDRINIVKWFKAGNLVCPKTGQRVQSLELVPNLAIKEVIKQYCLENGVTLIIPRCKQASTRRNVDDQVADFAVQEATKMVADFLSLKLAMGTMGAKSKAAYEIRLLTKRSVFNRACFVESGAISYLLNLLLSKDSIAQENSMAALLNLSKHSHSKPIIVNLGGLGLIIRVLKNGFKVEARQYAAATLFYLSSVEEYRGLIGNNSEAIPSLVELVRFGNEQGRKSALVCLFSLLLLPVNHCKVLETKLVPSLVCLLGSMEISEDLVAESLAVLAALAEKPNGSRAILRARGVDVVVTILCSTSSNNSSRTGREHSVSLLLAMCINCRGEVVDVLVKNTSLMGALYSLLGQGNSMASKKASSLISILHECSERRSMRPASHALPRENFINVW